MRRGHSGASETFKEKRRLRDADLSGASLRTLGKPFAYVMARNIYMQFTREKELFISYGMRGAQKTLFNFH